MNHYRFLPSDHRWRGNGRIFDGTVKWGYPPPFLFGEHVIAQFVDVRSSDFDKKKRKEKRKQSANELNWIKKSIFFEPSTGRR